MRNYGFTLLELLVAMAIFAVLSTLAYSGLKSMLDAKNQVSSQAEQLTGLQTALTVIERDVEQAVARPIRGEIGETLPAMISIGGMEQVLELTRGGYSNPAGRLRSSEQRVAYRLEEDRLLRATWSELDRLPDSVPATQAILAGVESLKIEFLDDQDQWLDHWPPQGLTGQSADRLLELLPRAVAVTLEVAGWGRINRILLVRGR